MQSKLFITAIISCICSISALEDINNEYTPGIEGSRISTPEKSRDGASRNPKLFFGVSFEIYFAITITVIIGLKVGL